MNIQDVWQIGIQSLNRDPDTVDGRFPNSRYYSFFQSLVAVYKPKLTVVLGVCTGGDCFHISKGHPEGKVIGIDIANEYSDNMEYISSECPNFEFVLGDSVTSAPAILNEYGAPDLLFIDTSHFRDQTIAEWAAWRPYLKARSIVAMDDILFLGMLDVWDSISEPKIRMDFLHNGIYPHGGGFGVVVIPDGEPDYELGN